MVIKLNLFYQNFKRFKLWTYKSFQLFPFSLIIILALNTSAEETKTEIDSKNSSPLKNDLNLLGNADANSFESNSNQNDQSLGTNLSFTNKNDQSRRTTNFEWTPVPNALSYEIEITPIGRADGKNQPYSFSVENPSWDGELKPGKYSMRLRSKDKRNVPGEWSKTQEFQVKLYAPKIISPSQQNEIQSNSSNLHATTLKWEFQSEASLYKLQIKDESNNVLHNLESTSGEISLNLPVAKKYTWSIIGYDKQGIEGESLLEPIPFLIIGKAIDTPNIITPETQFVRILKWTRSEFADNYSYILYRRDKSKNRKWRKFQEGETKETSIPFSQKWAGGEYKLSVTAHGLLRKDSKTHSIIFDVAFGQRTIAAENRAILQKSIIRTNEWYFVASYFLTTIHYESHNGDTESNSSFTALGGTGRVGLGYFTKDHPYGFLGIVDYSGFTISNNTYKYPSAEIHGNYRFISDDIGEIRVSSGVYIKQLPEIIGSSASDFKVKSIDIFGLHLGGEYWYPLSSTLGLQLNGRIYYPLNGNTPTGQKINTTPSFLFGFLGSLRLNGNATGLMGYAYRKDQLNYKVSNISSLNAGDTTNSSSIVGHYVNFLLEWDL